MFAALNTFFSPPWMRIHSYMAGVIVGYLMVHLQKAKPKLSTQFVRCYWTVSSFVFVCSLFAGYFKDTSPFGFAIALSVGRLVMGLFWGSVVTMCFLGHGGVLQRFLSCTVLAHLNKVSYMMYLLNPVTISLLAGCQQSANHFETTSIVSIRCNIILNKIS